MSERQSLDSFLYVRLNGLAQTYSHTIIEDAIYPAIFFKCERFEEVSPQGERQWICADFRVMARDIGWAFPFDLQAEIDSELHGATAVIDGLAIRCERVSSETHADRIGDAQVRDAGGIYRLTASVAR